MHFIYVNNLAHLLVDTRIMINAGHIQYNIRLHCLIQMFILFRNIVLLQDCSLNYVNFISNNLLPPQNKCLSHLPYAHVRVMNRGPVGRGRKRI
jgi:hypothetical protein